MSMSKVTEYMTRIREAKTVVQKYDIQMEALSALSDREWDILFDILRKDKTLVNPKTVHMGLNTIKGDPEWEGLKEEIRKIVEVDGICKASWSCNGRTRHMWQSSILENDMPEYDFDIDENYKCEIRKR